MVDIKYVINRYKKAWNDALEMIGLKKPSASATKAGAQSVSTSPVAVEDHMSPRNPNPPGAVVKVVRRTI